MDGDGSPPHHTVKLGSRERRFGERSFFLGEAGMDMSKMAPAAVLASALWPAWYALGTEPFFMGLGDEPGEVFASYALAVTGDGSVVVGRGSSGPDDEAFRWTAAGGTQGLGDLPGGWFFSQAYDVSASGTVVVGYSRAELGYEAFRWTDSTGMVGLGLLPGGLHSEAWGVSADGSIVVGNGATTDGLSAFRWTSVDGIQSLNGPFSQSLAYDVSADGTAIVGDGWDPSGYEAFRWTESPGMQGLGILSGYAESHAFGISSDGSTVVGYCQSATSEQAFRWRESYGMEGLGDLAGGSPAPQSKALDASADGSVIVGFGSTPLGNEAFIWDTWNGMRNLKDMLEDDFGLDLSGWKLNTARSVSDDGRTIVGDGEHDGGHEAWIAHTHPIGTLIPGGVIDQNTVWTIEGSPYLIDGNVLLAPATLLQVEPGVEVRFLGNYEILISGQLIAEGTVDAPIRFVTDEYGEQWARLRFTDFTTNDYMLRYCLFEWSKLTTDRFLPLVEHCGFQHTVVESSNYPGDPIDGNVVIRNSIFTSSGIELSTQGTVVFEGNAVEHTDVGLQRMSIVQITGNLFLRDPSTYPMLNVSTSPASACDGIVSRNIFLGRGPKFVRYTGEVSQNRFQLGQVMAREAAGNWFGNDFEFQFPSDGEGGIRLPEPVGPLTFHDNNITFVGSPGPDDYLLHTENTPGLVIDAEMNWWGTDDPVVIEDLIYHFVDTPTCPYVDFVPFRTQAMPAIDQVTSLQNHGAAGEMGLGIYEWGPSVNIEPRLTGVSKLAATVAGTLDET
ncbi:MAG: hypothetical protein ACYSUI_03700, partial [Planctomycetota bacterium]